MRFVISLLLTHPEVLTGRSRTTPDRMGMWICISGAANLKTGTVMRGGYSVTVLSKGAKARIRLGLSFASGIEPIQRCRSTRAWSVPDESRVGERVPHDEPQPTAQQGSRRVRVLVARHGNQEGKHSPSLTFATPSNVVSLRLDTYK